MLNFIKIVPFFDRFRFLITIIDSGYLNEIGWYNSYKTKSPQNNQGDPIPWMTYSIIEFLNTKLNSTIKILEFGSGSSTHYFAKKCNHVDSIEHEKAWFEKVNLNKPANSTIHLTELVYGGEYSNYANNLNKKFELIIVDGRDRVNCLKNSFGFLTENGVMILDDSERDDYKEGVNFLISKGMKKIDFWGISPGLFYNKSSTLFYFENNCFNI